MAIIHDLVEIEAKDVPILDSINDSDRKSLKESLEAEAMGKIKGLLGADGDEVYNLWAEFEELKTNEALVLKAIDRLEGQMQIVSEDISTFKEQDQLAIAKLLEETTKLSEIDPFIVELDKITLDSRKNRIKY